MSPGGVVAVVLWVVASVLFGVYATNFASYDKTYGTLAGVIVFLVWLWISNLAILLGAELDAELERQRAIAAGMPPAREPYMRLRDDRAVEAAHDQEPGLGERPELVRSAPRTDPARSEPARSEPARSDPARSGPARRDSGDRAAAVSAGATAGAVIGVVATLAVIWVRRQRR